MKCNQSRPGFELVSPCPFPTTITIPPRAPPKINILYHRHHQVPSLAWISMILSVYLCSFFLSFFLSFFIYLFIYFHPSLSSIAPCRFYKLYPVSTQSWYRYVHADQPRLACPCVVFWLVITSSSNNNKTNHDMWGKIVIFTGKEYLQERDCS